MRKVLQKVGYQLCKPLLFSLDAERAHELTLNSLNRSHRSGLLNLVSPPPPQDPVELMGLHFPNRIGLGAGMDKTASCAAAFARLGFGFVEVGTITPRPQPGNPAPRLFRIPKEEALINRMGFNNVGAEQSLKNLEQNKPENEAIVGINIGKNFDTPNENALDDYLSCMDTFYEAADYLTVNISSPNTKGLRDLQGEEALEKLLNGLIEKRAKLQDRFQKQVPLLLKLAPDLSDGELRRMAGQVLAQGFEGIIATNTSLARFSIVDPLVGETGGCSGRPLQDLANQAMQSIRSEVGDSLALVGSGGIHNAAAAKERIEAGADLIQLYTGLVYQGPALIHQASQAASA